MMGVCRKCVTLMLGFHDYNMLIQHNHNIHSKILLKYFKKYLCCDSINFYYNM
jgi:hypothetical protein